MKFSIVSTLVLCAALGACSKKSATPTAATPIEQSSPSVRQLVFDGDGISTDLTVGGTRQLRAVATLSDGTSEDVTAQATWSSTQPGVASVIAGLVRGLGQGQSDVVVQYSGATGALPVRIVQQTSAQADPPSTPAPNPGPSPSPTPDPAPVPLPLGLALLGNSLLAPGQTSQLQVTQRMSDGSTRDVTTQAEYSSDNPAVVTVSGAGLLTGSGVGVTTVRVRHGGNSLTLPVVVSPLGNPL